MPSLLLVSDSEWVDNDVLASLGVGDWSVQVLDDPREAASEVAKLLPDVVLIDLQVGSMGGMAVVHDIGDSISDEDRPRLVLLLDREADAFLARRAGADAWVVKPFSGHELRETLTVTIPA